MQKLKRVFPMFVLTVLLIISLTLVGCGGSKSSNGSSNGSTESNTTVGFLPANNATNVCIDTPLKITFDSTPILNNNGYIHIYKSGVSSPVDTINMADSAVDFKNTTVYYGASTKINAIGYNTDQLRFVNYSPVIISGNTATIYPHNNKLEYGATYYVTIDASVFTGTINGTSFVGISGSTAWTFSTKSTAPDISSGIITVDDDAISNGELANFCTVQGAIDSIPAKSTTAYTIQIADGTYNELLFLRYKSNITFNGMSQAGTIIQYDNYDSLNNGTGSGTTVPATGFVVGSTTLSRGGRAVMLISGACNITFNNLTLQNTHEKVSGLNNQAETIYFNTSSAFSGIEPRLTAKNCNFISRQDTLQLKGVSWFYNCYISGDVDFIWGTATAALFENCEIHTRYDSTNSSSGGYIVQARCASGTKGFVFLNCNLTNDSGVPDGATYLARSSQTSGTNTSYYDNVAYLNCTMGSHIASQGWYVDSYGTNPSAATVTDGWKEYGNTKSGNSFLSTLSGTNGTTKSLALTATQYSTYFGSRSIILNGWDPTP